MDQRQRTELKTALYGIREYLILLGSTQEGDWYGELPESPAQLTHWQKRKIAELAYRRLNQAIRLTEAIACDGDDELSDVPF